MSCREYVGILLRVWFFVPRSKVAPRVLYIMTRPWQIYFAGMGLFCCLEGAEAGQKPISSEGVFMGQDVVSMLLSEKSK